MKNWTIGRRIIFGFSVVILVVIALGSFAYVRLANIKKETNTIATDGLPSLQIITEIQPLALQNYSATLRMILAKNADEEARELATIQKNILAINELTNAYNLTIRSPKERELFNTLIQARANYVPAFKEVCQLSKEQKNSEAVEAVRTKLNPASLRLMDAIDAEVAFNKATVDSAIKEIQLAASSATTGISIGLAGAILLALVISFLIIRAVNSVLGRVSGSLSSGADELTSAASQVAMASQTLAEGASEQAASLEETSASLEEMSSMTKRNAESSVKANDLAKQAREAADKGSEDMQTMSQAMNDIKASSDDIAKIIRTIDEIAFQTNILALNAAVEAARAGEAGMGFAVVADEVRNLAQRSAQAAKETAAKIEGAISKTAQGVVISGKVVQTLVEITAKIRQVDELVAEVAGASKEQSQGIFQVNTAVGQMDKVTQSNAANAEESASAAEELKAQADCMKAAIGELLQLVGGQPQKAVNQKASFASETPAPREVTNGKSHGNGHARLAKTQSRNEPLRVAALQSPTAPDRSKIPMEGDFQDF